MLSKFFKLLIGLTVPVLGVNPIKAQILTQVFHVFILSLVIVGMLILINKKSLMGEHKAGMNLNIGLVSALIFACIVALNGIVAIIDTY